MKARNKSDIRSFFGKSNKLGPGQPVSKFNHSDTNLDDVHLSPEPAVSTPSGSSTMDSNVHSQQLESSDLLVPVPNTGADEKCVQVALTSSSQEGRTFHESWKKTFPWIQVIEAKNDGMEAIVCSICSQGVKEQGIKFPDSIGNRNCIRVFVEQGFTGWKNATRGFKNHEKCLIHTECMKILSGKITNVAQALDSVAKKDSVIAREALKRIFSSLKFLANQGLAIRGHADSTSNLQRLLKLRSDDNEALNTWLNRKGKNKWLGHDIINESLHMLGVAVREKILAEIRKCEFFAIMLDETTDISTQEQVSICIRTVSADSYEINEYFIGFYNTDRTDAESLFQIVKTALSECNLDIQKCRGQAYDGAAAVSGRVTGLQERIKQIEPSAFFVHCNAHRLNLVVQETCMKNISAVHSFLTTIREMITFVRSSPKRLAIFNSVSLNELNNGECEGQVDEDDPESKIPDGSLSTSVSSCSFKKGNLRPFCPTRWLLRVSSVKSVRNRYSDLLAFFHHLQNSEEKEGADVKAKAHGFFVQLMLFETYFLVNVIIDVFEKIELLNQALQQKTLNFRDCKEMVDSVKQSLKVQRESGFDELWSRTVAEASELDLEEPVIKRKRKIPRRLDDHPETQHVFYSAKEQYKILYLEIIDQALTSLNTRFNDATVSSLIGVENFLLDKKESVDQVMKLYSKDFSDPDRLVLHRNMLLDCIPQGKKFTNLNDVVNFLKNNKALSSMLPEVNKLVIILLTIPVTTCTNERTFSLLRRIKTYLRSTMTEVRLNDVALLNFYAAESDDLDLNTIINDFVLKNSFRKNTFGVK